MRTSGDGRVWGDERFLWEFRAYHVVAIANVTDRYLDFDKERSVQPTKRISDIEIWPVIETMRPLFGPSDCPRAVIQARIPDEVYTCA